MKYFISILLIIISLRGLFIPVDLIFFRNSYSHLIILLSVITLLILYKSQIRINCFSIICISFLVLHVFFHAYLMQANIRYILYLMIIFLSLSTKINFSRILQLLTITFSVYLVLALGLHFFVISLGQQFEWSITYIDIFKSNNDAYLRSQWGESYYSPYLFLLIGEWGYDIKNFSFIRFMGFSPEPSLMCMILIPLFFVALYFANTINRSYNVCSFIIGVSIVFSFSIYCVICIIASFIIFYNLINFNLLRLSLSVLILSTLNYFLLPHITLFNVILEEKKNEFIFYTETLDIFSRISSPSYFGIDTSHYANESIRSYGVFSVYEKYGIIGFTLWTITIYLFIYYSVKLSKYRKYKYFSCALIAIALYSFKSPHLINLYFILFLIQSIYYINVQKNISLIRKNNTKNITKPVFVQ